MKNIGDLNAEQLRTWATAEVELAQARATQDEKYARCKELRARYEPKLADSDDPKDAGKDVKVARAGGWQIRRSSFDGGETFSIKDFRGAGNEVTDAMAPFINQSKRKRFTVKRLAGPTKPGAVEPV